MYRRGGIAHVFASGRFLHEYWFKFTAMYCHWDYVVPHQQVSDHCIRHNAKFSRWKLRWLKKISSRFFLMTPKCKKILPTSRFFDKMFHKCKFKIFVLGQCASRFAGTCLQCNMGCPYSRDRPRVREILIMSSLYIINIFILCGFFPNIIYVCIELVVLRINEYIISKFILKM